MRPYIARTIGPATAANTSPPQSTTPGLHPVSIYQMTPPDRTSDCSLLRFYPPRKDERLSWLTWLTCSGRFTHIGGHPSDAGRAQDRESSPAKDRRSTTVPRHQLSYSYGADKKCKTALSIYTYCLFANQEMLYLKFKTQKKIFMYDS